MYKRQEQRKLESAKARALQEAEELLGRLADVIPMLDSGLTPKDLLDQKYLSKDGQPNDSAVSMVTNMNQFLQQEIDRLSDENAQMDEQLAAVGASPVGDYMANAGVAAEDAAQNVVAAGVQELMAEEELPEIAMPEGLDDIDNQWEDEDFEELDAEVPQENAASLAEHTACLLYTSFDGAVKLDLKSKVRNGKLYVDQGIIAGCAGGGFENICDGADILKGASIGPDEFTLSVYPASTPIYMELVKNGAVASLMETGAIVKTAFCGPCFGAGDTPANNAFSIRHSTRNFPNREGSKVQKGQVASVALDVYKRQNILRKMGLRKSRMWMKSWIISAQRTSRLPLQQQRIRNVQNSISHRLVSMINLISL